MILQQAIPALGTARLSVFAPGRFSTNPTILRVGGGFLCLVKGVNFDLEEIRGSGDWQALDRSEPISIRYRLAHLDEDLRVVDCFDFDTSEVEARIGGRADVEDLRLFWCDGAVWACGCALERDIVWRGARWLVGATRSRVFVGEVVLDRLENVRVFDSPVGAASEKNWAPVSSAREIVLVTNVETGGRLVCDAALSAVSASPGQDLRWRDWSGSSALMPFAGGYLAVAHRKTLAEPYVYSHLLVSFDADLKPRRLSDPFSFEGGPVEFCCGLDIDADSVAFSYGVMDKAAAIARFRRAAVEGLLKRDAAAGSFCRAGRG